MRDVTSSIAVVLATLIISFCIHNAYTARTSDDDGSSPWSPSSQSDSGRDPSYPPRSQPKNEYSARPLSPRYDANGRITATRHQVSYSGLYQGTGTQTGGYRGELPDKRHGDVIGHAQPARLGGSGTSHYNTFAQNGRVNNGAWKTQENALFQAIANRPEADRNVLVTHERTYEPGSNSRRPTHTQIRAESPGGTRIFESERVHNPVQTPPRSRSLSPVGSRSSSRSPSPVRTTLPRSYKRSGGGSTSSRKQTRRG